ncbi:ABC transporter substrate-binding protein [Fredinandcohnia humi]
MKKQKYLSFMLTVLFVISVVLTGCKGDGPGSEPASGDTDEKDSGKTVVNFWTPQWGDADQEWWEKNIKAYNESQDEVVVKLEIVPGDAWDQKVVAAQAAGTSPDIMTMNYNKIIFSAEQGKILPLDEYVDPAIFEDLYDNVRDFVSLDGKHYAYPMLGEPSSVLFYRKDMFEEAGLDPEQPPTTWDELLEYGKKLTNGNVFGLAAAGNAVEYGWTHWGLQGMVGAKPVSDDWSEATIVSEEYKELITFWNSLYQEGVLPKQALGPYNDIKPLGEGQVAMQIGGSWSIGQLRTDYPDLLDKIGVAVMPTNDGNQEKTTASLGGWTLTIDGNSKHPQEAADFISWLLAGDEEIMVDFFKNVTKFSKFPARKSVDEVLSADPEGQNDPWRKLIAEKIVPYTVAEPIYAWEFSMSYATALERVMLQGEDIEKSLQTAEKEINDYIKNNNYAGTNPKAK